MGFVIKCIEASDCKGAEGEGTTLTEGRKYVTSDHSSTGWQITNDRGALIWVGMSCFQLV